MRPKTQLYDSIAMRKADTTIYIILISPASFYNLATHTITEAASSSLESAVA